MISRMLKRQDQRSRLFGEMLHRFSGDTTRDMTMSDGFTLAKAISRCRNCGATERCEDWVANSEGTEGADEFCPNAETFRQLADPAK